MPATPANCRPPDTQSGRRHEVAASRFDEPEARGRHNAYLAEGASRVQSLGLRSFILRRHP